MLWQTLTTCALVHFRHLVLSYQVNVDAGKQLKSLHHTLITHWIHRTWFSRPGIEHSYSDQNNVDIRIWIVKLGGQINLQGVVEYFFFFSQNLTKPPSTILKWRKYQTKRMKTRVSSLGSSKLLQCAEVLCGSTGKEWIGVCVQEAHK